MKKRHLAAALPLLFSLQLTAAEWRGNAALEYTQFPNSPLSDVQIDNDLSASIEAELYHDFGSDWNLVFTPFVRIRSDDAERNHSDLREAKLQFASGDWEMQVGLIKVFWGVTETQHLVDIINQTDAVENLDGEDKLGQPAINVTWNQNWGAADFYLMPGFRERTFPGEKGRLRLPFLVDTENPLYESDNEDRHLDFATRISGTFLDYWDGGLSWFKGTSRDPEFIPDNSSGATVLRPYYAQITQIGLDLQATLDAWLLKLEAIQRESETTDYSAAVGGFEYTLVGIANSDGDLGILSEYHHDSRGQDGGSILQNDLFIGGRWTANDSQSTEALAGLFIDLDNDSRAMRIEASRRIWEDWKISAEAQLFENTHEDDPQYVFREDGFFRLELAYFF